MDLAQIDGWAEGTDVDVRQTYTGGWSPGFEVAQVDLTGEVPTVQVRRRCDGRILPCAFPVTSVRAHRSRWR